MVPFRSLGAISYSPSIVLVSMAALFYSPVDYTDASDLHQTVVKFIGWSIESDKITLLKIKFNRENCQQKDTLLIFKQMSRRMIDSPRCCFIPLIGWKFDASMHTSVRCVGEINWWIKQRSLYGRIRSHFGDIQRQTMAWPWNLGLGPFKLIENGTVR